MSADSRRALETGEVLSFVLAAGVMLSSSIIFPSYLWLFILLALIDGLATRFRSGRLLILDRIAYALVVIILGAISLGFDAPGMILETIALITFLDFVSLLRQIRARSRSDFLTIISARLRSYLYTLVPAAVFSAGLTYIGALTIGITIGPANAILALGLASIAVFLIILFMASKPPENLK